MDQRQQSRHEKSLWPINVGGRGFTTGISSRGSVLGLMKLFFEKQTNY